MSDRGEEDQSRGRLPIVFLGQHPIDGFGKVLLEPVQGSWAFEGLVVAEEAEYDVGFDLG